MVFVSYSHRDRDFVDALASRLLQDRVHIWLDRHELKVGDSIVGKIQDALADLDFLAVILSPNSVEAPWCKQELRSVLAKELKGNEKLVLPILLEDCEIPAFLEDRFYADFRTSFEVGYASLKEALGTLASGTSDWTEDGDYKIDFAFDWTIDKDELHFVIESVSFSKKLDYSILGTVTLVGNAAQVHRLRSFAKAGFEREGVGVMISALGEMLDQAGARILVPSGEVATLVVESKDTKSDRATSIRIRARRLGAPSQMDVVFHWGSLIAAAGRSFATNLEAIQKSSRAKDFLKVLVS